MPASLVLPSLRRHSPRRKTAVAAELAVLVETVNGRLVVADGGGKVVIGLLLKEALLQQASKVVGGGKNNSGGHEERRESGEDFCFHGVSLAD